MKRYNKLLIFIPVVLISIMPAFSNAQAGKFLTCSGLDCTLCDLLELAKRLITFMLEIGIALAVLFIAYGAFVIMTAGATGQEKNLGEGKKIIWTAVSGVAIGLMAWLIVGTALQIFTGSPSAFPWTEIKCSLK